MNEWDISFTFYILIVYILSSPQYVKLVKATFRQMISIHPCRSELWIAIKKKTFSKLYNKTDFTLKYDQWRNYSFSETIFVWVDAWRLFPSSEVKDLKGWISAWCLRWTETGRWKVKIHLEGLTLWPASLNTAELTTKLPRNRFTANVCGNSASPWTEGLWAFFPM